MRRFSLLPPPVVDALIALPFVVVGQLDVWLPLGDGGPSVEGSRALNAALVGVLTLALALRRRAPLAGLLAMVGAGLAQVFAGDHSLFFAGFVPVAFQVYALAAWRPARTSAAGLGIALAATLAIVLRDDALKVTNEVPFSYVVLGVAYALGSLVRYGRVRAETAETHAGTLERQRAEVLADERARIARELHDVIAHSVSVMVVQAGAARLVLDEDAARARDGLLAVERTGRQALEEMRRLLGMLRTDQAAPVLLPQPSLAELDALVEQVREAGLPVDVEVEGEPAELPPGVDLAAYRVVQEALTNALRHAGPARARVRLRYGVDEVELEVVDDGRGGGSGAFGGGHGLVGMRERVELYGGRLETGRRREGGYAVRARLPVAT